MKIFGIDAAVDLNRIVVRLIHRYDKNQFWSKWLLQVRHFRGLQIDTEQLFIAILLNKEYIEYILLSGYKILFYKIFVPVFWLKNHIGPYLSLLLSTNQVKDRTYIKLKL